MAINTVTLLMETNRQKIFTVLELLCVFCWFLLDGFWLMEWPDITYATSVLSVGLAVGMFFYIRYETTLIFVSCADTCWLVANVLWAYGDLSKQAMALIWAKQAFFVGLFFCVCAFLSAPPGKKLSFLILSRLRILKFFSAK